MDLEARISLLSSDECVLYLLLIATLPQKIGMRIIMFLLLKETHRYHSGKFLNT